MKRGFNVHIIGAGVIGGVLVAALLRMIVVSDVFYIIRLHQTFGWIAIALWYGLLLVGSLLFVLGDSSSTLKALGKHRKSIGLVAAGYALIHGFIGLFQRLGGFDGLSFLPSTFQWSIAFGFFALLILAIMAVLSLLPVAAKLPMRVWNVLGYMGRFAGLVVFFHVWLIGNHAAVTPFREILFAALFALVWLEVYRLTTVIFSPQKSSNGSRTLIVIMISSVVACSTFLIPLQLKNYASTHSHDGSYEYGHGH